MEFKGAVLKLQRALDAITDRQTLLLLREIRRYFRDVADHHTRVVEQLSGYDDLLTSILPTRLAQVTVAQNNDMRRIAAWTAIAAMKTAIAGIHGINVDAMPELHWRDGYPGVLTLMLLSSVALYRRLRRAGWF